MKLADIPIEEVRGMLSGAIPGAHAGQAIPEALALLETAPVEIALLFSELVRRNLVPLHRAELGTYEDAAKWLVIPELQRRLQKGERAQAELRAELEVAYKIMEANNFKTPLSDEVTP